MPKVQSAVIGCRLCNFTIPKENHIPIKTATGTIYVCAHHLGDWMVKVRAATAKICDIAGSNCAKVSGIGKEIQATSSPDQIAIHAERLLEAIYNKADHLKKAVMESIADFRKALFVLAHLLGYSKTAEAFI